MCNRVWTGEDRLLEIETYRQQRVKAIPHYTTRRQDKLDHLCKYVKLVQGAKPSLHARGKIGIFGKNRSSRILHLSRKKA